MANVLKETVAEQIDYIFSGIGAKMFLYPKTEYDPRVGTNVTRAVVEWQMALRTADDVIKAIYEYDPTPQAYDVKITHAGKDYQLNEPMDVLVTVATIMGNQ